jgi:hypothetical protein
MKIFVTPFLRYVYAFYRFLQNVAFRIQDPRAFCKKQINSRLYQMDFDTEWNFFICQIYVIK